MTHWDETNFLERLMPYLGQDEAGARDACPDAESLVAFWEGKLEGGKRRAIQVHLANCLSCMQLKERLASFDKTDLQEFDADWRIAEKRLDNWVQAFLQSQAKGSRRQEAEHPVEDRPRLWGWLYIPRVRYAAGATVVLTLVIAAVSVFVARKGMVTPHVASVAQPQTSAKTQHVEAIPSATIPAPVEVDKTQSNQPKVATGKINGVPLPIEVAQSKSPMAPGTAKPMEVVPLKGNLEPGSSLPPVPLGQPSTASSGLAFPQEIRIEAGQGLLIRFESTTGHLNGHFAFRGSLVRPFSEGSRTILPAKTVVEGSGAIAGAELLLRVEMIEAGAFVYALKNAETEPGVRGPTDRAGVGSLQGQTLEVRFSTSSVYERRSNQPKVWRVPREK